MPSEFSNPEYVDAAGSVASSVALEVANSFARLALSLGAATGKVVKQLDDDSSWMLKAGGAPAVAGDWVSIGTPASSLTWDTLPDKPETFPSATHDHDGRYFTETEVTGALASLSAGIAGKADAEHGHNQADIDGLAGVLTALSEGVASKADADAVIPPGQNLAEPPQNDYYQFVSNFTNANANLRIVQLDMTLSPISIQFGTSAVAATGIAWDAGLRQILVTLHTTAGVITATANSILALFASTFPGSTDFAWELAIASDGTGLVEVLAQTAFVPFGGTPGTFGQSAKWPHVDEFAVASIKLAICVSTARPYRWHIVADDTKVMHI